MSCTLKFALAGLCLALAPAALADPGETVSRRVAYSDLDMSSAAGGTILLGRLEKAARRLCDDVTGHSPMLRRTAMTCRRETVDAAVRDLGIASLNLAWNGKN